MTLGLTADVAAAHRNEPPSSDTPTSQRSSFWPSALSTPDPVSSEPIHGSSRHSMASVASEQTPQDRPVLSPESDLDAYSDSAYSRTNSVTSSRQRVGSESKKRHKRQLTSYRFAHPPPTIIHKQRLHIKPKLLLQLQRLSTSIRPTPVLDILPSSVCGPRFARKWPRFFPNKIGLGTNDLIVVGSEKYQTLATSEAGAKDKPEDEGEDARPVVATICQSRSKDDSESTSKAEIRFSDGPLWQAMSLSTGAYDFSAMDEHGLKQTVRWVRRRAAKGQSPSLVSQSHAETSTRFGFSIIDPRTRRHPILANMTAASIDIFDAPMYRPSSTEEDIDQPLLRASFSSTRRSSYVDGMGPLKRPPFLQSDERLRMLILVSGTWVAFREGWSGEIRRGQDRLSALPVSSITAGSSSGRPSSVPFHGRSRAKSMSIDDRKQVTDIRNLIIANGTSPPSSTVPNKSTTTIPKRANSTGTAFMRKAKIADKVLQKPFDQASAPPDGKSPIDTVSDKALQDPQGTGQELEISEARAETASGERRQRRRSRASISLAAKISSEKDSLGRQGQSWQDQGRKPPRPSLGNDKGEKKWKKMKGLIGLFQKH